MPDTTAKIRAKGLDATGVTEEIADQMYQSKGRHYMGIVELKVDETHEKADGQKGVHLIITQLEPATNADLEDHLRELTRTVYFNRQTNPGQYTLDVGVGDERTVADVIAAGAGHKPHPFIPDDAAKDDPICDVCGQLEAAPAHSVQDALPDDTDDDQDDDTEEPAADPWVVEDPFIPHNTGGDAA